MPRNEGNVELWSQLSVLVAEVSTVLDRRIEQEFGLGMTDFLALKALCGQDSSDLRMRDLSVLLGLNQSSATRAVGRLERDGLAERVPDPEDGRGVIVRVTAEGRDLTAEIAALFSREVSAALDAAALDRRTASVVARLLQEPGK
ncbi:MarR family transcriptional regulator [Streptomyces sp. NPDC047046]|uniref:MarR family winged helix-turn-helix transcriptional regulator n=1 Tax=Streptomyces sp. NPDC047046 TaxID=3155378 RepID=UPI0033FE788A